MKQTRTIHRHVCAGILALMLCAGTLPMNSVRPEELSGISITVFAEGGDLQVSKDIALKCIAESTYAIFSAGELAALRDAINSTGEYAQSLANCVGMTFQLQNDIDLSGYCNEENGVSWKPIGGDGNGGFRGIFDGNGFTVKGMYIGQNNGVEGTGLFTRLTNAVIENLTVEGKITASGNYSGGIGGICGSGSATTFKNCVSIVTIQAPEQNYVGGIIGMQNIAGDLVNCVNKCDITGGVGTGGITGGFSGQLENCKNFGNITGTSYVGGVIGKSYSDGSVGKITACSNFGTVSGKDYVGGVMGRSGGSFFTDCHNSASVTASKTSDTCCGGLAGSAKSSTFEKSSNSGSVSGSTEIGGLAGRADFSKFYGSFNTGDVNGSVRVAGLAGAGNSMEFSRCYNACNVSAESLAAGILSDGECILTDCYSYGDVTVENGTAYPLACAYTSGKVTPLNCYFDVSSFVGTSAAESTFAKTRESFNSGAVCILLNENDNNDENVWFQTLEGENPDKSPVLAGKTPDEPMTPTEVLTLPQDSIKLRSEKSYRIPLITNSLTYTALTPEIADVTADGLVIALAKGKASIKVMDTSGRETVLTVEVVAPDTNPYPLGNTNGDEAINAKDAATVLIAAARLGTGGATGFTDEQAISADVNNDGAINAKDANIILRYAAAVGTGRATNIKDYI